MEIFYIDLDTFLKSVDISSLEDCFDLKNIKANERKIQYAIGRFLLEFISKTKYKVKNTEVIIENKKPRFKNNQINFSISHSKNIVMIAFDDFPAGLDIESLKERSFSKILKYLNINLKEVNKENFYTFWTQYEAGIKLQNQPNSTLTFKFADNFIVSIASSQAFNIAKHLEIYEVSICTTKFNKPVNLQTILSESTKNALIVRKINIALSDILPPLNSGY